MFIEMTAKCITCDEPVTYDRALEFFGHDQLPVDSHAAIPKYIRSRTVMSTSKGLTKADYITAEGLLSLAFTPCNLSCGGCGTYLPTEADFARHFTVPDATFLNLGDCPAK